MSSKLTAASRRKAAADARLRRQRLGPVLTLDDATLAAKAEAGPNDMAETEAFIRDASPLGAALFRAKRA